MQDYILNSVSGNLDRIPEDCDSSSGIRAGHRCMGRDFCGEHVVSAGEGPGFHPASFGAVARLSLRGFLAMAGSLTPEPCRRDRDPQSSCLLHVSDPCSMGSEKPDSLTVARVFHCSGLCSLPAASVRAQEFAKLSQGMASNLAQQLSQSRKCRAQVQVSTVPRLPLWMQAFQPCPSAEHMIM